MGKWTKTAGLLFLAAASVYSSQLITEAAEKRAVSAKQQSVVVADAPQAAAKPPVAFYAAPDSGSTDVKVLEDSTDPFATSDAPATAPTGEAATASTDEGVTEAPATQPSEGRSVSSSEVSVNDAGTVEIHVNDANLVEVLRMLSLQSQKNIVASKDVHGSVTANLYDVTVREALDAILHANGYAYREKGNFIYVYTAKEIAEIEAKERQMRTEVLRVYYTPAINAANMIKPVLSKTGGEVAVTTPSKAGISSAPAGGAGNDHASDEIIVVTDYPENLEAARKILAEVDRRPQQILLEATILRARLNEDNALGVDFNIMGGVDLAGVVNGGPQITNSGVNKPVAIDPATGLPGEPSVLGADGVLAPGRNHTVGTGNAFTAPITNGLKVGYVTDSVSLFLSALEQVTDTTVLANPKVLALNRQQGEVFVGNEDGYYTTVTTETTSSQSVQSLKTGTRLIFRPFIGADGYVRMEVHPEDSDGSVKASGLPSKTTTEVTSNIMVKDGHTIVIGGLFRESTVSGRSQVPFLGNIPVAGMLFKSQRDRTVREEVIILLTPHIVKDDAAYSRLSEEQLKHTEDLRVGTRKGMMPWGRERLAEGWYEAAKRELAKPNPNRGAAKFHLDCATNLNPQFTEAIELKEQITGYEVTQADGSSVRGFLRRVMLTDVVPTTAPVTAQAPASTQPSDATAEAPSTQPSEDSETAGLAPAMVGTAEASVNDEVSVPSEEQQSADPAQIAPATTEPATTEPQSESISEPVDSENSETSTEVMPLEESNEPAATEPTESESTPSTESTEASDPLSANTGATATEENSSAGEQTVTVTPLEDVIATEGSDEEVQK